MRTDPASADHHLHISSAQAAAFQDQIEVDLGEREPDSEPSSAVRAEQVIRALDVAGVDAGAVLSNAYMFGWPGSEPENEAELVRAENEYVAEQVALYPSRLVALCSVHPLRPYALTEVRRCGEDPRIAGLKLHLANSDVDLRNADDLDALGAIFEEAEAGGLPVMIHMRTLAPDYGAPDVDAFVDQVLARTSTLTVQIAHMAGWGGFDGNTAAALRAFLAAQAEGRVDLDRVTFGLGAVVFLPEAAGADTATRHRVEQANQELADLIREIGIERVVYATDWPGWPPIQDSDQGIAANIRLIRSALPLDADEFEVVFANVGPIFGSLLAQPRP